MNGQVSFQMIPLSRVLYVEGQLRAPEGEFRGLVLAVGCWTPEPEGPAQGPVRSRRGSRRRQPPEPQFLVSDVNRASPFWVSSSEITRQVHGFADGPVGS